MDRVTWRPLLIGALTVPWLAGCSLLLGPDFEGEFPEPSLIATFETGSATITLGDGTVIELPTLAPNSDLRTTMGSNARWTGADGWHLTVNGAGAEGMFGASAFMALDRVTGGEHWTTSLGFDDRCIVDVERADETALQGSATCKGAVWYDALDQSFGFDDGPRPLDEPKFDAEITFEARP